MFISTLKRCVAAFLITALALSVVACASPGGRFYTSSEKSVTKAENLLSAATAKTNKVSNGIYDYSFFVTLKAGDVDLKMGTQNVITFTDKGTESSRIHRKNNFVSAKNGISLTTVSEDHYYVGGVIHTTKFGENYKSSINEAGFLDFTETSEISVNLDYLAIKNFKNATVYSCGGGVTEIACTGATDAIKEGIFAFIGFNENSGYVYTARDISLICVIEDDKLTEQRLSFKVDYHPTYYPDQLLTYNGDFSFTLTESNKVTVETPPVGTSYAGISDIKLLNSVTSEGYKVLSSLTSLDATYDEYISVSDASGQNYVYDVDARFTEHLMGDKLYYGSIDNKSITGKGSKLNTITGIFCDDAGYHERVYDKEKNKTDKTDKGKPDNTNAEIMAMVANTFSTHMLLESDISNFKIQSDSQTQITFTMRLSSEAAKYYTVSLMSVFADDTSGITDPNALPSISYRENTVSVTVRKSDGCIIAHSVDFKAVIGSSIEVVGKYSMKVNSTADNISVLGLQDFENRISQ